MGRLVAVDAVPGVEFVDALRRAWDRGDAVFPLDPRLPEEARRLALATARVDEPVDDGDALVVATGGTTGEPKAVVLTHDAVAASARAASARLDVDPSTDRWLVALPLAHIGGLAVVTRAMATGTPLTFDEAEPATLTAMVPTQLERTDVSCFRVVLVGGGGDWRRRPANVVHTYGMTETGSGVAYDGTALPEVELRVVDGEIFVRGPMLLRCYRDGTDPKDADGWLATGDAGELQNDKLLVRGRMGEVIVTGGEKVWPTTVEQALRRHPAVADVAVNGRPDPEWGARVTAWVVPADPTSPPSLDGLRQHVKQLLPAWCAPRELVLVEALPRTAAGKLRHHAMDW